MCMASSPKYALVMASQRTLQSKQAAAFRRSGNSDLADVLDEASRVIACQEARILRLAELGYVPEEPTRPTAM